jgi:RimJ/RimL family protein N-acetyltransferase
MGNQVIKILEPGDEALLEAFLLPRLESSMFLLGNMRASGLLDNGQAYEGSYAALFEDEKIVGVVAHYWNANLVFQATGYENMLWQAAVEASGRPIGGLIGPNDQVLVARDALRIVDSGVQMDQEEKLYSLKLEDMIVPDPLSSGQVVGRRIGPGDLELLTEWRVAFNIEATGAEEGPELWETSRVSLERSQKEGHTWVLEREGEAVACSSFNTAIKEAVQIGGVWTPPELRRRGYGRCVVATSLLDARAEGVEKSVLFTGEENLAAQKAYTALGFRHIGDYRLVLLQPQIRMVY